jgi:hypothetical protein
MCVHVVKAVLDGLAMKLRNAFLFASTSILLLAACSGDGSTASTDDSLKASCHKASDCHGALPDICELCGDGTSECAHWACESGKCVDVICPATKPECTKASDCTGPLPDICERCGDGKTECAHWECTSGKCETTTCGS